MKSYLLFICCVAVAVNAAVVRQWPPDEEQALNKCSLEFSMDKEDARRVLSHRAPADTENKKCLMACYMKDRGMLVDHKVKWNEIYEAHASRIPDPAAKERMKQTFEMCEKKFVYGDKTDCQIAYDAYNCN